MAASFEMTGEGMTPDPPKVLVSIIAPMFQMESTLPHFLAALSRLKSPQGGHEIIVVDNGSTDRSREIIGACPNIRLLHQPIRGAYAARNLGVAHASGDILVFIDPDCEPDPGWLLKFEERLRDPSVWAVCGARLPGTRSYWVSLIAHYELAKDAEVIGGSDASRLYGYTNNMAIRREAWELVGPFDQIARGADTVFVRRLADRLGADAVDFEAGARVRHSELSSISAYLHKTYLYGRTRRRNLAQDSLVHSRPLSIWERLQIYHRVRREQRYGPIRASCLAILLLEGWLAWQLGWWHGGRAEAGQPVSVKR